MVAFCYSCYIHFNRLSLLCRITKKIRLFPIPYNSNYISIFQNAGNSLAFTHKPCATVENILIRIIWYLQQYLVFPFISAIEMLNEYLLQFPDLPERR